MPDRKDVPPWRSKKADLPCPQLAFAADDPVSLAEIVGGVFFSTEIHKCEGLGLLPEAFS
ncbi:hypothetical protein [Tabrizicola sp. BL-A-41-H6]|uniref:hypothetical protein n=1 Tax=Tabrizicola sp. BL-A-41-H6 TaxID=3421107 RepID=UPI003D6692E5